MSSPKKIDGLFETNNRDSSHDYGFKKRKDKFKENKKRERKNLLGD